MTVAPVLRRVHHGAGSRTRGSPKGRSPTSGARPGVASSGQLRSGVRSTSGALSDRAAPADRYAEGSGTDLVQRGWSSYAFSLLDSPSDRHTLRKDSEVKRYARENGNRRRQIWNRSLHTRDRPVVPGV